MCQNVDEEEIKKNKSAKILLIADENSKKTWY